MKGIVFICFLTRGSLWPRERLGSEGHEQVPKDSPSSTVHFIHVLWYAL